MRRFAFLVAVMLSGLAGGVGGSSQSFVLIAEGDALLSTGDLPHALASYRKSLLIAEKLYAANPSHSNTQRALFVSRASVADVLMSQGDLHRALAHYRKSLAVAQKLVDAVPINTQAQQELALSHEWTVLSSPGELPRAPTSSWKPLARAESLAADPSNRQLQRNLLVTLEKVGNAHRSLGDAPRAHACYQKFLAFAESLVAADSSNMQAQRDLLVALEKAANVQESQGHLPAALSSYRKSLAIAEILADVDPSNTQAQRDLLVALEKVGKAQESRGDLSDALASYRKSLAIAEKLYAANSSHTQAQRDLLVSFEKVGNALESKGDLPGAFSFYRKSKAIALELYAANLTSKQAQREVSLIESKVNAVAPKLMTFDFQVLDCDGLPVPGAQLTVNGQTAEYDSFTGLHRVTAQLSGALDLTVSALGFLPVNRKGIGAIGRPPQIHLRREGDPWYFVNGVPVAYSSRPRDILVKMRGHDAAGRRVEIARTAQRLLSLPALAGYSLVNVDWEAGLGKFSRPADVSRILLRAPLDLPAAHVAALKVLREDVSVIYAGPLIVHGETYGGAMAMGMKIHVYPNTQMKSYDEGHAFAVKWGCRYDVEAHAMVFEADAGRIVEEAAKALVASGLFSEVEMEVYIEAVVG